MDILLNQLTAAGGFLLPPPYARNTAYPSAVNETACKNVVKRGGSAAVKHKRKKENGCYHNKRSLKVNNLACYKVDKADKYSRNAGLTDSATLEAEEHIHKRRKLTALLNNGKGSSACYKVGIRGDERTCASNYLREADKHKHTGGSSGVSKVCAKTAKEALNHDDGKDATDNALPYGCICTEGEREDKTCYDSRKVKYALFLFKYKIENELRNHAGKHAGSHNEKGADTVNECTCNKGGEKRDDNVKHYARGIMACLKMRRGRNYKLIHLFLPP
jgi:hypothetical protein